MPYLVKPDVRKVVVKLTLTSPLQHTDPRPGSGGSNERLFSRQKKKINRETAQINWQDVRNFVHGLQWPDALQQLADGTGFSVVDVLGVMVLRLYVEQHNNEGLMTGINRYRLLENRAKNCAIKSNNILEFWSALNRALGADSTTNVKAYVQDTETEQRMAVGVSERTLKLTTFMPKALGAMVLSAIAKNAASYVMLVQAWNEYATSGEMVAVNVTDAMLTDGSSDLLADVPIFSANAIRHKLVREPAALHLLNALGLRLEQLDAGTASLLYNGGEMNHSPEGNVYEMTRQIRQSYPSLGLLGGSTTGFLLGSSNVEVSCWPIAREYADDLFDYAQDSAIHEALAISVFAYLDDQTNTRHTAGRVNGSPMPFNNEILAAGLQLLVEFRLRPYATELEMGALGLALQTFNEAFGTIGGASARGNGTVQVEYLQFPANMTECMNAYEAYLQANVSELAKGLQDGKLTTERQVMMKAKQEKETKAKTKHTPPQRPDPEWNDDDESSRLF